MKITRYKIILLSILMVMPALCSVDASVSPPSETFPVYSCIESNVAFWKKIYSEYSTTQGVIHDKRNLGIIYGVIDLKDRDRHGSRKINRKRIKAAKKHYKKILAKLARGEPPEGAEEQRVANLFGSEAQRADFRSAMRNLRCQVGQKDPFRQGVIRSGAYLEEIKRIFRGLGLPEDLVYLPHVESSFNPKAYSKFGAAGIWQFTRSTGKQFMTVSYAVDERRDPILSSRAAARLLKKNFKKFSNWPMAITAYNHGATGMLRAKRSKGSYEAIFKRYRSRLFKFASRNFYSEFLAAREVAINYRQYFGELELDQPIETQEIVLAGYGSLPEIASQLKLDLAVLHKLNPALRNPVLRGQKYVPRGFQLRLPAASGQDWQSLMAELAPRIFKNYQKRSRIYTVRRGDTAGEIARIHGVNLHDLIAANNLDARATIYVNQNLSIPLEGEKGPVLASVKSDQVQKEEISKSKEPELLVEASAPEPTPILARLDLDTIESYREAESAPVQMAEKKPAAKPTSITDPPAEPYVSPVPALKPEVIQGNLTVEDIRTQHGKRIGIIRVEVEETLGHYADWLEIPTWEIRRLNGFKYGKIIRINQPIKIPLHQVTKEKFEENRFEYHKELAEDFFASYRVEKVQTYTIKRGDNIWTLANQEFEVPLWLIKKYNADLDFNALVPAQKVLIPIIEKIA
jgi:membrane-bound lytic murein transglycosylase D